MNRFFKYTKFLLLIFVFIFGLFLFPKFALATAAGSGNPISSSTSYNINYNASPCAEANFALAIKTVGRVVSIIQIAVPIILVIMALVDITKSIVSSDDSKSRKNISTLIKRLISAVIVFFVIAIVRLVCGLAGENSMDSCLNLISKPW